jgi:hypothetical protein
LTIWNTKRSIYRYDSINIYQIISHKSEGFIRIKKCEGCYLNERNNNSSKSCWISVFKYNIFNIDIVNDNYIRRQMKFG